MPSYRRYARSRRRDTAMGAWVGWALALAIAGGWAVFRPAPQPISAQEAATEVPALYFKLCSEGGGADCVIDGDTFRLNGEKIRIADIDTPETHPPRCASEAALGEQATLRLQSLLNEGTFALAAIDRDVDRYGRKLRRVMRDGQSIGDTLVAEGLARPYAGGYRDGWCG